MKFKGEVRFPEIDHPGIPATFVVEESQAELVVDGESLGRWSLFDVKARRLVSSAFAIDIEGTEITFVADDPIDFAYRGVEHMAEAWAEISSKPFARRRLAVNKSRRGAIPSRLDELAEAMKANLAAAEPKTSAGFTAFSGDEPPAAADEPTAVPMAEDPARESEASARPFMEPVSEAVPPVVATPEEMFTDPTPAAAPPPDLATGDEPALPGLDAEMAELERQRRELAEERLRLEEEMRAAEQREANRVEAYRLEMERLEREREEVRQAMAAEVGSEVPDGAEVSPPAAEPPVSETPQPARTPWMSPDLEPAAADTPEPVEEAVEEMEPVLAAESLEPVEEAVEEMEPVLAAQSLEPVEEAIEEVEPALEAEGVGLTEGDLDDVPSVIPQSVLDLSNIESNAGAAVASQPAGGGEVDEELDSEPESEPALAGAPREKSGLMGAVKSAFARNGGRAHEHTFMEAPGGIGITRYVCEDCGHVSISVGDG